MKFLLDTHLLLWAANEPERLPKAARALIVTPDNELLFSAASIWEVAIKSARGRKNFQSNASVFRRALIDNGYEELEITSEHALHLERLPDIRWDPFDRILVCQATVEGLTLLTNDEKVAQYPGPIRKV
jgi:PIN domain nuclease of toxin-antitoxin system